MLKKIQNDKAESRYRETQEHYRREMEQNPALTLKAYCQMSYVYHRGLLRWMRKEGIKKPVHKTSGALKCGYCLPEPNSDTTWEKYSSRYILMNIS